MVPQPQQQAQRRACSPCTVTDALQLTNEDFQEQQVLWGLSAGIFTRSQSPGRSQRM